MMRSSGGSGGMHQSVELEDEGQPLRCKQCQPNVYKNHLCHLEAALAHMSSVDGILPFLMANNCIPFQARTGMVPN